MTELIVENIDAGYGEAQVLWDLNIRVRERSITVLLGSNGAGKTTTLRVISGILRPWRGSVKFNGVDITDLPAYERVNRGIVLVPEGRRLWPQMTVYQHLELGAYTKEARDRFQDNLETVFNLFPRLKERRDQLAGTLSGGEQQMLAIARALMASPKILLLDEPSLGLAPKLVIETLSLIRRLRDERDLTVLLVEQDVYMALQIADYGYILEQGRIILEGDKDTILNSDIVRKAYLGI